MSKVTVQEVFGQFAVEIAGAVKLYASEAEATKVAVLAEKEQEFYEEGVAFAASLGFNIDDEKTGKTAKGKANVVIAYLAWVEGGKPEAPEPEAKEESKDDDF